MQVGHDQQTSTNCKSQFQFRLDELLSFFVLNFNSIFSISSGYRQTEYQFPTCIKPCPLHAIKPAILMTKLFTFLTILLLGCGMTSNKPTMTLDEILTKEREQYVATYKLGISQSGTTKQATEILIKTTSDQNREHPELYQHNRYDLVIVNAQKKFDFHEFNLDKDSVLKFDTQSFSIDGIDVEIEPFVWNGCEFTVDEKPNFMFESWAKKWIDIEDNKEVPKDSFSNVIHSVTFPKQEGNKWTISIDFGTAPIEAFKELLTTLNRQGIKHVEVHSKTFTD
jgi:hypothetical protein